MKSKPGRGKVRLNVRLDHQVNFGEHVVILGSAKELGSWKKNVGLNWTENGWVCELELQGGESVEFKFVIVGKGKSVVWESGDNRVVKLPKGGSFGMVCKWDATGEAVELLPLGFGENEEQEEEDFGDNGSAISTAASPLETEASPFVGQWQGKSATFMQSNEHRNRESDRRWDTSGLEGFALKLVEGDRSARNWWQKVLLLILLLPTFRLMGIFYNSYMLHSTFYLFLYVCCLLCI